MALWKDPAAKDSPTGTTEPAAASPEPALRVVDRPAAGTEPQRKTPSGPAKESLIAGDITIEGKIEGSGHVRIAGRFKGDVNVQGNVTIEQGAHVTGQVPPRPCGQRRTTSRRPCQCWPRRPSAGGAAPSRRAVPRGT